MTELLTHAISLINDCFLGYVLMAALIFSGLYFTIATRFVQFVRPKEMLKLMISGGEETRGTGHISPFQAQLSKTQPGGRAAVAWPVLWTADTLLKVWQTPDLLNPQKRVKIPRSVIYSTMLLTPPILLSNSLFNKWLTAKLRKFN